jgi:hypothetical protein
MAFIHLILVLTMLTAGCDHILYQRFEKPMWSSYIRLHEVKPGMSRAEVVGIMGQPQTKEEGDYPGGHYVVYFYLTHSMDFEESNTVRGGYTPLVFKGDRLMSIGARDYRLAVDRPLQEGAPRQDLPWGRTH